MTRQRYGPSQDSESPTAASLHLVQALETSSAVGTVTFGPQVVALGGQSLPLPKGHLGTLCSQSKQRVRPLAPQWEGLAWAVPGKWAGERHMPWGAEHAEPQDRTLHVTIAWSIIQPAPNISTENGLEAEQAWFQATEQSSTQE